MAKIAVLAAKMFEEIELHYPRYRLLEAGHDVVVPFSPGRTDETRQLVLGETRILAGSTQF